MVNECGNSFLKLSFFLTNLLICLFGALICGFSLWANLDKDFGGHLSSFVQKIDGVDPHYIEEIAQYQASLWILVAVGALLFAVGFLGCCGSGCENQVFLGLFVFILVILTAIELGSAVFAMTNREEFVSTIHQILEKSSATPELRKNIKPIQDVFKCCGATEQSQKLFIQDGLCGAEQEINCYDRIAHMVQSWGESIFVVALALFAIELLAILFSCILCRASRNNGYTEFQN